MTKVTKKKVVKKKKAEEPKIKALSEVEMLTIELANKDMRLVELELLVMSHKKKILDLEFESEVSKKRVAHKSLVDKKATLLEGLSDKYKLKSSLNGYDSITGEIKDE